MADVRAAAISALRPSMAIVVGVVLVAGYGAIRMTAAPEPLLVGWIVAAAAAALLAPAAGLIVLAALGPFTEAVTDDGRITAVPYLLATLGAGLLIALARSAVAHRLPRPSLPILLAAALFIGTLGAVGLSAVSFGSAFGLEALRLWVPGIGGGLTVLAAAWFVAYRGEYRPVLIVVASVTLAALLSVLDAIGDGLLRDGALGWLLRPDVGTRRLTGIIPAPNPAAAIFLAAIAISAAAVIFVRRLDGRLLAGAATAVLAAAVLLTYSRSGLLALAAIGGLLAWSYRRWLGLSLVAGAALVFGVTALIGPDIGLVRTVPAWADEDRVAAWSSAVAMWADAPLTGHGFRSFEWLHSQYGATLDAPHNEWLRFFAEAGVLVGLAALGFAVTALVALLATPGWLAAGGAAAVAGLVVMAAFNNPFMYVQVNVPAFLVIGTALGAVAGGKRDEQPPPSTVEDVDEPPTSTH